MQRADRARTRAVCGHVLLRTQLKPGRARRGMRHTACGMRRAAGQRQAATSSKLQAASGKRQAGHMPLDAAQPTRTEPARRFRPATRLHARVVHPRPFLLCPQHPHHCHLSTASAMPLQAFDIAKFPVPLDQYTPVPLSLSNKQLTLEQKAALQKNIQILRDAIIFFTASGAARGGACPPLPSPCLSCSCLSRSVPPADSVSPLASLGSHRRPLRHRPRGCAAALPVRWP